MSKTELFVLLSLGYLTFELLFIRIGFFLGNTIGTYTTITSFLVYCIVLIYFTLLAKSPKKEKIERSLVMFGFICVSLCLIGVSLLLSHTYDTSWDGQGYHQTAVIALANGWNPVWEPSIKLNQHLPSQIFAEGYPSALWEIEAGIYALTSRINSAKIINIAIGLISITVAYILFRKLLFGRILSFITSLLVVIQPVYIRQLLTFMQDGFGYQLILIAASALIIICISAKSYWAIAVFVMAELLLVSTKYSHLPVALVLGIIFILVIGNRFLNKEYLFIKQIKLFVVGLVLCSLLLAYLPYIRNGFAYGAIFYPTNIPDLMGSVKYNNVPTNLSGDNKFNLLYYGIFSRAQSRESGDPRSETNIAELKLPFTFSPKEIYDSAALFNNRVGAGGPIFSGIVVISLIYLIFVSLKTKNVKQRYAVYTSFFSFSVILFLSLLTPSPNLLRYVSQIQLIPFAIIIPIYAVIKNSYTQTFTVGILALIYVNTALYSNAVIQRSFLETNQMNAQLQEMKDSGKEYLVGAQQFYSNYIILAEQKIPFTAVSYLECDGGKKQLVASSNTTHFCEKSDQ